MALFRPTYTDKKTGGQVDSREGGSRSAEPPRRLRWSL
jgi:hypothetical protein